jgi:hypothetical protein
MMEMRLRVPVRVCVGGGNSHPFMKSYKSSEISASAPCQAIIKVMSQRGSVSMRYLFVLFVLLSSLLLSACGEVEGVKTSTVDSVPLTYTGVYRLLEPGEVERFLRDHPEQEKNLPQMLESSSGVSLV